MQVFFLVLIVLKFDGAADIVFDYRQKVTRSFEYLQGDYYIAPLFMVFYIFLVFLMGVYWIKIIIAAFFIIKLCLIDQSLYFVVFTDDFNCTLARDGENNNVVRVKIVALNGSELASHL